MAFYHPSISKLKDRFLIADNIEEVIFCKYNNISLRSEMSTPISRM